LDKSYFFHNQEFNSSFWKTQAEKRPQVIISYRLGKQRRTFRKRLSFIEQLLQFYYWHY